MKYCLLVCLLFSAPLSVFAQMPGKAVEEYKTPSGTTFHRGDTLRFGRGSNPNGAFIYAYIPAKLLGSPRVYFNTSWAGGKAVIKELRYQELKKGGDHRTIAIVKTNTINGVVELDQAEEVREILSPNNKQAAAQSAPTGVADELIKLKSLLDAKAISQEEYDKQKAKLLK
jgi:hypothetical protein